MYILISHSFGGSLCTVCTLFSFPAAKYDAEMEAKENKEAKDKQLAKIEEARRKAAEDKGVCLIT